MASPRLPGAYPKEWEADVVLRDGSTAHVRPIRPSDAAELQRMHRAQSERSIYLRYFTYKSELTPKELDRFTHVDHVNRVALVITRRKEIIAIGRFDHLENTSEAEVAFNVADAHHGMGLGSILLEHLVAAGRELGLRRFTAEVLPENRQMLTVFADAGFDVTRRFEDGVVMVSFDIDPTVRSVEVMESREHRAEARSLAELLQPDSVAVIGSTRDGLGRTVMESLVQGGFRGELVAVNPRATTAGESVQDGVRLVSRITEVGHSIDLAVVAVAQEHLLSVARDCAQAGVKGMIVMTAGFRTPAALAIQRELVRVSRANGMRVVGPASFGVVNTSEDVLLFATPAARKPVRGGLGLFSQSAALGSMLDAVVRRHGLGVSASVNAGHRADVSGNDLMQYFEDDPATKVVGMYLESFGNPRKFSRIARRLSRAKPVVVAKSDYMGLRLPPGHDARTTQAPAGAVSAMLRQSGVIQVKSQESLADVSQLLLSQPLPGGPRVAVLSNSDSLASVVAEHAMARDLSVTLVVDDLDPLATPDSVPDGLPDLAAHTGHRAVPGLSEAVASASARADVDAIVVVLLPVPGASGHDLAATVVAASGDTTVLGCFAGHMGQDAPVTGIVEGLPCYPNLTACMNALNLAVIYRRWLEQDPGELTEPEGIDRDRARTLVDGYTEGWAGTGLKRLGQDEAAELLGCYGVRVNRSVGFTTVDEALAAAAEVGYPVALKTTDEMLSHRLDLGGVRLNINSEEALRHDIESMRQVLSDYGDVHLEVQAMSPAGQGCLVRALEDPLMGPLVSFGLTGDAVNLLDDWAHAAAPFSPGVVHDMIREPRAAAKLFGYEGLPPLDTEALEDLLTRIGRLKDDLPQVAMIEFNPVLVSRDGIHVLSADVRVGNPVQRTDSARRAMSLPGRNRSQS
ncbi:GNAT family N-acetyltransferase [Galactobacter sp.]|uniref:bifunctional acetate--CoA ligase family protein/GNAT family N-acetyltransferase n=1 Tax=Galactobacter sp. TaxID=2676125 RepID=UPI0025B8E7A7|nr:GNAT family N-acetyltransferase [Galactobacter sp.]